MNDKEIKILMQDRCTEQEAIKLLSTGTIVYDDPEEYFNELKSTDGEEADELINDIKAGKTPDTPLVKYEGHTYLIAYVL